MSRVRRGHVVQAVTSLGRFAGRRAVLVIAMSLTACGSTQPPIGETSDAQADDGGRSVIEVDIPPPASPEEGWQWTVPAFAVAPGSEVQQCFFFEVPYDVPVYVDKVSIAQTTGSHHMNVFRVRTVNGLDGADGDVVVDGPCWTAPNWADWPLVINSQNEGRVDMTLPEGVAHKFAPHEKLMLQSHYVNAQTQTTPGAGKVIVDFHRIADGAVTAELGTAFATNQSVRVCPGELAAHVEASCRFGQSAPVTIVGANGHFHSRGTRFTMSTFDPFTGDGAQFYESTSWNEPLFAKNLGIQIPAQGGIRYACDYSVSADQCGDPSKDCCFTFGGKVEFQEHCNAFVYYYPRVDTDIRCF
jgi:hypothetical protein